MRFWNWFVLCCWEIRNLREMDQYGDGYTLDYGVFFGSSESDMHSGANEMWSGLLGGRAHPGNVRISPFSGKSPFSPVRK